MYRHTQALILIYSLLLAISGCGKDTATGSGGGVSRLANQISDISGHLVPQSLSFTQTLAATGAGEVYGALNSDPCNGGDLFACQPVLVRIYISLNKMFSDQATAILTVVSSKLGVLADGATGGVTETDAIIYYSKVNDGNFSILAKTNPGGAPFFYASLAGSVFTVKIDIANMPGGTGGGGPTQGVFEITGTYTDTDSWNVITHMAGMDCQADDVGAPGSLRVQVTKANGVWKGKTMMYNPQFGASGGTNCATPVTDSTAMTLYTDFVADDLAAKASVYAMKRNHGTVADINSFALKDLGNIYSLPPGTNLSAYSNPFCNPSSSNTAIWGNSCGAISAAVAAADFSPSTDWVAPSSFYPIALTLPSSL